ncbi:tetratricopeptide repeat protein [Faecalibaculum rodentium]|uniref:tetratricopeptide repeat protein n=1 Tax=Faecalibaculum rodentium TaxID=1702221 RepID=UPI0026090AD0|nr:hypothetical protein [Faecalibaculum rodentium]
MSATIGTVTGSVVGLIPLSGLFAKVTLYPEGSVMDMEQELLNDVIREYRQLLEAGDLPAALPLIRQAAHWGDLESQILAADLYMNTLQDPAQALEYTRLAALNGDTESMLNLGVMLRERREFDKAFYFIQKAAMAGCTRAYEPLAAMYMMGQGTLRDLQQAKYWNLQGLEADPENAGLQRQHRVLEKAGC